MLRNRVAIVEIVQDLKVCRNPVFMLLALIILNCILSGSLIAEASEARGDLSGSKTILIKINPTKYLVRIKNAKNPFWLTLDQSFHNQWRIYVAGKEADSNDPKGNTRMESSEKSLAEFIPQDIKFLFKRPLNVEHKMVKGYANGWYIEPAKLNLNRDFTLVIYFWPQALFYLGLSISIIIALASLSYIIINYLTRKLKHGNL